ncbi:hypothetical protein Q2T40_10300 [Winogradskyella maritima]|uniref:Outer membrane protein with beta-barrel domain n=1 Tax=Winogradskyella maritima TaxID=1517766 RepID=A0ABV8AN79_9FLAO|nr:hypothetical protein [Winogradskyella maritima]
MKLFFAPIALLFIIQLNAQDLNYLDIENRKGQVFFKIGTEYRITPLPYDAETVYPVQVDKQNSGLAFSGALDYFISKNLSLGFGNSIRYDYLGGFNSSPNGDFDIQTSNRGLIFGFHLYVDYNFKIFKESEIYLRVGRSLLNRGTQLDIKETFFDNDGNELFTSFGVTDASYEPWNFGLGWKKRKIELLAGIYTSNITEYFLVNESFVVPYLKFSYNLGRL